MSEDLQELHVLVVDDEVRIADSLVQILIARGYQATAAYSAETAMKMAAKLKPCAVISDIVMGPVSGIELANHIREHYPGCKILLISGHATNREVSSGFGGRQGAIQFLPKPVQPEHILEFVASCAPRPEQAPSAAEQAD